MWISSKTHLPRLYWKKNNNRSVQTYNKKWLVINLKIIKCQKTQNKTKRNRHFFVSPLSYLTPGTAWGSAGAKQRMIAYTSGWNPFLLMGSDWNESVVVSHLSPWAPATAGILMLQLVGGSTTMKGPHTVHLQGPTMRAALNPKPGHWSPLHLSWCP